MPKPKALPLPIPLRTASRTVSGCCTCKAVETDGEQLDAFRPVGDLGGCGGDGGQNGEAGLVGFALAQAICSSAV